MKKNYLTIFKLLFLQCIFLACLTAGAQNGNSNVSFGLDPKMKGYDPEKNSEANYAGFRAPIAYGVNVAAADLYTVDLADPTIVSSVASVAVTPASGDFQGSDPGHMWLIDLLTNELQKLEIATGNVVQSVPVPVPVVGGFWTVIAIHPVTGTFYLIATDGGESVLYEVDPDSGTLGGGFPLGLPAVISGTFDATGMMYVFEIGMDEMYTVDPMNGSVMPLGPAGFDGNFAQGMGYDPVNDEVYLAAYDNNAGAQLRLLDRGTGNTLLLGPLPNETTAFGVPSVTEAEVYSVPEVYNNPDIQSGDMIFVEGYYTEPETSLLVDNYGDAISDEVFPMQSFLSLTGVIPPVEAWNGGYIYVRGTISFEINPEPYYPDDTLTAVLEAVNVYVFFDGFGVVPDKDLVFPDPTEACDSCKFAILISGGVNNHNNHKKYWDNLVALYNHKTATENYCPENVIVHYFQGNRRDNRIPQERVHIANKDSIKKSFDEISRRVAKCTAQGKEATFQKMVTNHGRADGDINLLNNEVLQPADLKQWQEQIIDSCCSKMYDEFLQCYAGHVVDELSGMDNEDKATIYVNSNTNQNPGWGFTSGVHEYLKAKIASLAAGNDYPDAVAAAKIGYDTYLQGAINRSHNRAQMWRNRVPGVWYPIGDSLERRYTQAELDAKVAAAVADSLSQANGICKARNVSIHPMKEYCEWKKIVVPPGGHLVLKFKGGTGNCGNVSVYKGSKDNKIGEWNWNLPGSYGYQNGFNERVINGDSLTSTVFWIHNDNGAYTLTASANGGRVHDTLVSEFNPIQYAGSSYGGNDNSTDEFSMIFEPEYFYDNIDAIPMSTLNLPGYLGGEFVRLFGFSFGIVPDDPYWTDMELYLDVNEVWQPGPLTIMSENSPYGMLEVMIEEAGIYTIPLGDMTMQGEFGFMTMEVPFSGSDLVFSIDSWGLRSVYDELNPNQQVVELAQGWSGISGYIIPENPVLFDLMMPVWDQLRLMQDDLGNLFWPEQEIFTLDMWNPNEGYILNMNSPATLTLNGEPIQEPVVFLNQGWNVMPVPVPGEYPSALVFEGIPGFVIAKEVAGTGVFWPEYGINTMEMLLEGNAYFVNVTEDAMGFFNLTDAIPVSPEAKQSPVESPWNPVIANPVSHIIAFDLNESPFENGDVIGAFTESGWCAGITEIDDQTEPFAVAAFAQDNSKEEVTGFLHGGEISFRLYRASTGELFRMEATYDPDLAEGHFTGHGLSRVTAVTLKALGVAEEIGRHVRIYPNPNTGRFNITSDFDRIKVDIYSAFGEKIFSRDLPGKTVINISEHARGTYFIRLETPAGVFYDKIISY